MRARSSARVSGGRCRRRQRWCREFAWDWTFCGRGVRRLGRRAAMSQRSRKRSFLFRGENSKSKNEKARRRLRLFSFWWCGSRRFFGEVSSPENDNSSSPLPSNGSSRRRERLEERSEERRV